MSLGRCRLPLLLIFGLLPIAIHSVTASEREGSRVICAGGAEVFILDLESAEKGKIKKDWSWMGTVENGVPQEQLKWFRNLDECRAVDGGKRILICASNSGCGLIDRATGKLIWSASVTNAHCVEQLPSDRIVAASSLSGDHLLLFDINREPSDKPLWKTPLKSAHGLIWDDKRQVLWALGYDELRQYALKDWKTTNPSLELQNTYSLPDADGHDLRSVPGSSDLLVTTEKSVLLFDWDQATFRPHPVVGKLENVKAIDIHPTSGRIVYSKWGPKITLVGPDAEIEVKGNTVYKVRWFTEGSK